MLIIARQDDIDNLYTIWNTSTNRFLGVNLSYNDCIETVIGYKECPYNEAKERVDNPRPFSDIAKQIYFGLGLDCVANESDIRNAVRLIINHYRSNNDFRNAFTASISSVLKELKIESDLEHTSKSIANRIIGEE